MLKNCYEVKNDLTEKQQSLFIQVQCTLILLFNQLQTFIIHHLRMHLSNIFVDCSELNTGVDYINSCLLEHLHSCQFNILGR